MVDRLTRAPAERACIGSEHNAMIIEEIIMEKRWPKFQCKTCGKMHDASIVKLRNSESGGEYQFCECECPDAPAQEAAE